MYRYGYPKSGWFVPLLLFLALMVLFSGGFHRARFFFWPLFCVFPFFIAAGITALFAARRRWWFGAYQKRKHSNPYDSEPYYEEKPKRGDDSEIFYV